MELAKKLRAACKLSDLYDIWSSLNKEIRYSVIKEKVLYFILIIFFSILLVSASVAGLSWKMVAYGLFLVYFMYAIAKLETGDPTKTLDEVFVPRFRELLGEMEYVYLSSPMMDDNLVNEDTQNHIKKALAGAFFLYIDALVKELNKYGKASKTESNEIVFVGCRTSSVSLSEVNDMAENYIKEFSDGFRLRCDRASDICFGKADNGKPRETCYLRYYKIFDRELKIKIV